MGELDGVICSSAAAYGPMRASRASLPGDRSASFCSAGRRGANPVVVLGLGELCLRLRLGELGLAWRKARRPHSGTVHPKDSPARRR